MNVEIKLFALARQLAGRAAVEVELFDGARLADLRAALGRQCPKLSPLLDQMLFAVDNEYAADDCSITREMTIACIPPVSGG